MKQSVAGIAGAAGLDAGSRIFALLAAIHKRDAILTAENPVVVDSDCCFADGQALSGTAAWAQLLHSGGLAGIEGAFTVAWFAGDGSLHLARDALGERSLYYAITDGGLVFSSSVHSILSSGCIAGEIHLPAVARYLTYAYNPGRETLLKNIFALLPGEELIWNAGLLRRTFFWQIPAETPTHDTEDKLRYDLRTLLEKAVARRLPEGNVAATLSGGIDSSLVVALAHQAGSTINTFSVSFGEGYANELPFSNLVARHCGTNHQIVEVSPGAISSQLDACIRLLSEPIGDPLTVPNALLFAAGRQHAQVVLNGEGGDPCFGGPKNLPMLLSRFFGDGDEDIDFEHERSYLRAHLKCYDDLPLLLADSVQENLKQCASMESEIKPYLDDARFPSYIHRLSAINVVLKGGHHILPKVDAIGRAYGVLPRSPLFDRSVVEMAFRIPPHMKLMGSVEKYLLKAAVSDLLPREIIERPKSGMLVPVEAWFSPGGRLKNAGPLWKFGRERILDSKFFSQWFRRPYLEKLVNGRLGGVRPRHGAKVWLLVTLESWLRSLPTSPRSSLDSR
ncbi:MAG: asparagine synthetase B family protein [Turneriella sp.]